MKRWVGTILRCSSKRIVANWRLRPSPYTEGIRLAAHARGKMEGVVLHLLFGLALTLAWQSNAPADLSKNPLFAPLTYEALPDPLPDAGVEIAADQAPAQDPGAVRDQSGARDQAGAAPPIPISKQQPKRILGIMPNYRAVSAGAIPPPPTPKQAFIIATRNSFDYSSFIFVGITSLLAEGTNAHPLLGHGIEGYGKYYWRGLADKTIGNYMVIFALPTVFHQDERYYAKGEGGFWKRGTYAASRILITPNYKGHASFNASEVLGRAIAQGISREYYPSNDRSMGALAVKFGWAMGRDALTNVFREFWPDIATHVLHRHP